MGCESSKEEMGSEASNADASAKVPSAADAPRIPETQETQIFLTHDWADDELGRSNHDRVKRVYRGLKDMGISAWFDEEELSGDINQKMAQGIDNAKTVGVFVTERYINKASGKGEAGADDNCKFEFDYALRQKGVASIIVLVMEPRCLNPATWTGTVGGKLGGLLYIDLTKDGPPFEAGVQRLAREILASIPGNTPEPSSASCSPHPQPRSLLEAPAAQAPSTIRRLASLSVDEVCTVLRNLDLGKYEAGFRAVPVDGAIFSTVNDDGLREMGMDVGVLRTALLHRVSGFRAEGVALKLLVEAGGAPPDETTEAGGVPPETVESEAAKSRVQGSKDVGLIISLMGAHKSSVGVQEAGCVSLIMIVAGNAESQAATAAQGGVEAVLGAMGAHESIAIVQQWGCFALVNLAANAENKGAIAAKGGIVAVLRAMGAHASSAGVQEYGCWALGNLAGNVENAVAIAAQGGITAVLRAMGAHGPSAIVQEKGCWALHTIAWPDSGLRSQVRDAAAVPLVQKALAAFPGAVDLQEHGKGLLEKLSA